jgi:group II intron reverse transcriptase/maturase
MMMETPSSPPVSTKQQRIAELARQIPNEPLTNLSHYIDEAWLREAWRRTRKDGAAGVDGQTAAEYEENLRDNLWSLLNRAKSGRYKAPPVRRVHIPKGRDKTRPIGIPTIEDRVLQRAVLMALEPIYEQAFLPCSFGFRPGRSAHDALDALWQGTMEWGGGWLLEVDIQSFFDVLDHRHLREMLRHRVRDGVLLRLIGKWLKAGVLEDRAISRSSSGTPQGGVISPLLANVYLHEVLDKWMMDSVAPRLRGPVRLVRYADDFVLLFRNKGDAQRVFAELYGRFEEYGLKLHPEKTRLIEFRQPPFRQQDRPRVSFDFLGFTLFWGRSRKGGWILKRQTAKASLTRSLHQIRQWCRRNRHMPVREQHRILSAKLRGHCAYFGLTGNSAALQNFRHEVQRIWCKWLARRRGRTSGAWERFRRLTERYPLPPIRVVHSIYRT